MRAARNRLAWRLEQQEAAKLIVVALDLVCLLFRCSQTSP